MNEEMSLQEIVREEEAEKGFIIRDDVDAERVLKKIAAIKAESEEYIFQYKQRIEGIKSRCERDCAFYEAALETYFDSVEHHKTKSGESYTLANGKLERKHQAPEYKRDDAVLIPWLKTNYPDKVKVEESVNWAALKKLTVTNGASVSIKDTGECIPGIEAVDRPDKFSITAKENEE